MFRRIDPFGNPNTGVYIRATETHCFVPPGITEKEVAAVGEAVGIDPVQLTIGGSTLIGSLMAANRYGAVVADMILPHERETLEGLGLEVFELPHSRLNAAGNNILATDKGALVHPQLSSSIHDQLRDILRVPVVAGHIADVATVGMAAVATAKGVLAHPLASDADLQLLKSTFGVPARIGTVNHGHGLVGAGIVANTKGVLTGTPTTGIELGRIEDALGFLDSDSTEEEE